MITHSFVDADPIAYAGACICEKACYKWVKKDGSEESEKFKTALEAKEWAETLDMTGGDINEWERVRGVIIGTKEDAEKAVDGVVKDYVTTGIKLTGNDDLEFIGYLTDSGTPKVKDIEGLENRYQGNRNPDAKPALLSYCRDYLRKEYPWVIMAAKGFEADTHIVAKCEKMGDKAVGMFIDKDLAQMEEGQFIDMKRPRVVREITKTTKVGHLWTEKNARGVDQYKGHGFKWLVFQAMVGDAADGYKGFKGVGNKAAMKLLNPCTTKKECIEAALGLYTAKMKNGVLCKAAQEAGTKPEPNTIKYLSWDGKRVKLSPTQLLNQHLFLAYQERGSTDSCTVEQYL